MSNSINHDGRGQNVLYVGGHVRWAVQPTVGEDCDHIYINHHNRVGAGVCRIDSVLGSSDARPFVGE
jgi:prepilin-type processing-associated H-X9-DG protein